MYVTVFILGLSFILDYSPGSLPNMNCSFYLLLGFFSVVTGSSYVAHYLNISNSQVLFLILFYFFIKDFLQVIYQLLCLQPQPRFLLPIPWLHSSCPLSITCCLGLEFNVSKTKFIIYTTPLLIPRQDKTQLLCLDE